MRKCFGCDRDHEALLQGGRPQANPNGFAEDRPTPQRRLVAPERAE
jgi:hypothetical protein